MLCEDVWATCYDGYAICCDQTDGGCAYHREAPMRWLSEVFQALGLSTTSWQDMLVHLPRIKPLTFLLIVHSIVLHVVIRL